MGMLTNVPMNPETKTRSSCKIATTKVPSKMSVVRAVYISDRYFILVVPDRGKRFCRELRHGRVCSGYENADKKAYKHRPTTISTFLDGSKRQKTRHHRELQLRKMFPCTARPKFAYEIMEKT